MNQNIQVFYLVNFIFYALNVLAETSELAPLFLLISPQTPSFLCR
jgi:hypothetical protein